MFVIQSRRVIEAEAETSGKQFIRQQAILQWNQTTWQVSFQYHLDFVLSPLIISTSQWLFALFPYRKCDLYESNVRERKKTNEHQTNYSRSIKEHNGWYLLPSFRFEACLSHITQRYFFLHLVTPIDNGFKVYSTI